MKSKNTILLIAIFVQLNACAQNAEPNSQKESKINSAVAVQLRTIDENGVVQNVEQSNTQTSNEIKFVERWTVSSAFVTENQKLEKSDLLDSEAFFEFLKMVQLNSR
jgi:hypothetical protein